MSVGCLNKELALPADASGSNNGIRQLANPEKEIKQC